MSKLFVLDRSEDSSGISGIGVVADGTMYPNGKVTVCWRGPNSSVVVWDNIEEFQKVSCTHSKSVIKFIDGDYSSNIAKDGKIREIKWTVHTDNIVEVRNALIANYVDYKVVNGDGRWFDVFIYPVEARFQFFCDLMSSINDPNRRK